MKKRNVIYRGFRTERGVSVQALPDYGTAIFVENMPTRHDLRNHSPDGFEWGYNGSGPAQLALAMLAYHFGNCESGDYLSLAIYQDFKSQVISGLPKQEWRMQYPEIHLWFSHYLSRITGPKIEHFIARIGEAATERWFSEVEPKALKNGDDYGLLYSKFVNDSVHAVLTRHIGCKSAHAWRLLRRFGAVEN